MPSGTIVIEIVTALGLARGHRLLEMGCGALRAGAHIIEYLEPDRYWGVDIDELSLRAGVQYELPVRGLTARRPRFLLNANFELERLPGASGVLFDFVVFFAVLKPNIRKLWEPALARTRAACCRTLCCRLPAGARPMRTTSVCTRSHRCSDRVRACRSQAAARPVTAARAGPQYGRRRRQGKPLTRSRSARRLTAAPAA